MMYMLVYKPNIDGVPRDQYFDHLFVTVYDQVVL